MRLRLQPYPAYKDSGDVALGSVPAHWAVRSIGSIATAMSRRNRPDLPLLSVVRERGVIRRSSMSDDENHNFVPDDLNNYKVVEEGNLVVNKMKAWQGSMGIADRDGIVSPAYFVFDLRFITNPYAHRLLRSRQYVGLYARASDGVRIGQWDLNRDRFKRVPVLIPPLDEQHAIARFLDHADRRINRLIRAKRRLIELLNEQKQAIIHRAVTRGLDPNVRLKPSGIEWLGDVPEGWAVATVATHYSVKLGKMLDAKRITGNHLVPYVRNTDVQWDHVNADGLPMMDIRADEYQRYTLRPGDLLICEGGDVGRAAFWGDALPVCGFQKALHRLRTVNPAQDMPRFLFYLMFAASKYGVLAADGNENTIAHLTAVKLRRLRFPFPTLDEQTSIATRLDAAVADLDAANLRARREIELLREYRTRLIADVVTGKLDVRGVALPPLDDDEPLDALDAADGDDAAELLEGAEGGDGDD